MQLNVWNISSWNFYHEWRRGLLKRKMIFLSLRRNYIHKYVCIYIYIFNIPIDYNELFFWYSYSAAKESDLVRVILLVRRLNVDANVTMLKSFLRARMSSFQLSRWSYLPTLSLIRTLYALHSSRCWFQCSFWCSPEQYVTASQPPHWCFEGCLHHAQSSPACDGAHRN